MCICESWMHAWKPMLLYINILMRDFLFCKLFPFEIYPTARTHLLSVFFFFLKLHKNLLIRMHLIIPNSYYYMLIFVVVVGSLCQIEWIHFYFEVFQSTWFDIVTLISNGTCRKIPTTVFWSFQNKNVRETLSRIQKNNRNSEIVCYQKTKLKSL